MESDTQFAKTMKDMGVKMSRTSTGLAPTTQPSGFTRHHEIESGVLRLTPRQQHTPGSSFWDALHPGGIGGYSIWGK